MEWFAFANAVALTFEAVTFAALVACAALLLRADFNAATHRALALWLALLAVGHGLNLTRGFAGDGLAGLAWLGYWMRVSPYFTLSAPFVLAAFAAVLLRPRGDRTRDVAVAVLALGALAVVLWHALDRRAYTDPSEGIGFAFGPLLFLGNLAAATSAPIAWLVARGAARAPQEQRPWMRLVALGLLLAPLVTLGITAITFPLFLAQLAAPGPGTTLGPFGGLGLFTSLATAVLPLFAVPAAWTLWTSVRRDALGAQRRWAAVLLLAPLTAMGAWAAVVLLPPFDDLASFAGRSTLLLLLRGWFLAGYVLAAAGLLHSARAPAPAPAAGAEPAPA